MSRLVLNSLKTTLPKILFFKAHDLKFFTQRYVFTITILPAWQAKSTSWGLAKATPISFLNKHHASNILPTPFCPMLLCHVM